MKTILVETLVNCPFERAVETFNEDLFRFLVKGFPPIFIDRFDGLKEQDETHLRLTHPKGPLWISVMSDFEKKEDSWQFLDHGKSLPWPLQYWKHCHRVERVSINQSKVIDSIEFSSFVGTEVLMKIAFTMDMKMRGPKYKKYFNSDGNL